MSVWAEIWYLDYFKSEECNSEVTFYFFGQKYSSWANFVLKLIIVSSSLNLVSRLIRIFKIQRWYSFFSGFDQKYFYWINLVQRSRLTLEPGVWFLQSRTKYLEQSKNSSKIGQDCKSLRSNFACFLPLLPKFSL